MRDPRLVQAGCSPRSRRQRERRRRQPLPATLTQLDLLRGVERGYVRAGGPSTANIVISIKRMTTPLPRVAATRRSRASRGGRSRLYLVVRRRTNLLGRHCDRCAPRGDRRSGGRSQWITARGAPRRTDPASCRRPRPAPGHPLASVRDPQRPGGSRPPRRAAWTAGSGDARRSGLLCP